MSPLKVAKASKSKPTKRPRNSQRKTQQWLIPQTRRQRKRPHRKFSSNLQPTSVFGTLNPKIKRPILKVSLVPNSILGKLYGLKPKDFLPKIPKIKLNKPIRRLFDTDNTIFSCISSAARFQFDNDQVNKKDCIQNSNLQPNSILANHKISEMLLINFLCISDRLSSFCCRDIGFCKSCYGSRN